MEKVIFRKSKLTPGVPGAMRLFTFMCVTFILLLDLAEAGHLQYHQSKNMIPVLSSRNRRATSDGTSSPGAKKTCVVDYCKVFKPCKGNKKCVMAQDCKKAQCLDKDSNPATTVQPPTTRGTNLRPLSERTCDGDSFITCIHGIIDGCSEGMVSCICDDGWTGWFCNQPCTLECNHGNCQILDASMACVCEYQYTGQRCEKLIDG